MARSPKAQAQYQQKKAKKRTAREQKQRAHKPRLKKNQNQQCSKYQRPFTDSIHGLFVAQRKVLPGLVSASPIINKDGDCEGFKFNSEPWADASSAFACTQASSYSLQTQDTPTVETKEQAPVTATDLPSDVVSTSYQQDRVIDDECRKHIVFGNHGAVSLVLDDLSEMSAGLFHYTPEKVEKKQLGHFVCHSNSQTMWDNGRYEQQSGTCPALMPETHCELPQDDMLLQFIANAQTVLKHEPNDEEKDCAAKGEFYLTPIVATSNITADWKTTSTYLLPVLDKLAHFDLEQYVKDVVAKKSAINFVDIRSCCEFRIPSRNEVILVRADEKKQQKRLPEKEKELTVAQNYLSSALSLQQKLQQGQLEGYSKKEQEALNERLPHLEKKCSDLEKDIADIKAKLAAYETYNVIEALYVAGVQVPWNYVEYCARFTSFYDDQRYTISRYFFVNKDLALKLRELKRLNDGIYNCTLDAMCSMYESAQNTAVYHYLHCAENEKGAIGLFKISLSQLKNALALMEDPASAKAKAKAKKAKQTKKGSKKNNKAQPASTSEAKAAVTSTSTETEDGVKQQELVASEAAKLASDLTTIQEFLVSADLLIATCSDVDKQLRGALKQDNIAQSKTSKQQKSEQATNDSTTDTSTTEVNQSAKTTESSSVTEPCCASKGYKPHTKTDTSVEQAVQNVLQAAEKAKAALASWRDGKDITTLKDAAACFELEIEAASTVFAKKANAFQNMLEKFAQSYGKQFVELAAESESLAKELSLIRTLKQKCDSTAKAMSSWEKFVTGKADYYKKQFKQVLHAHGVSDSLGNPALSEIATALYDDKNKLLAKGNVVHIVHNAAKHFVKVVNQGKMPHKRDPNGFGTVFESRGNKDSYGESRIEGNKIVISIGRGKDGFKAELQQKDSASASSSTKQKEQQYRLQIQIDIPRSDYYLCESLKSKTTSFRIVVEHSRNPKQPDRFKLQLIKQGVPPLTNGRLEALSSYGINVNDYYDVQRWRKSVVGCDAGIRCWIFASSIGLAVVELFPNLDRYYQRLGNLQRKYAAVMKANNENKYDSDGRTKSKKEDPTPWKTTAESERLLKLIRKQYHKIKCERKQAHIRIANLVFALGGDFRIETMMWLALAKRRQNKEAAQGTATSEKALTPTASTTGDSYALKKDSASVANSAKADKSKSGQDCSNAITTANKTVANNQDQSSQKPDSKSSYRHSFPEQSNAQPARNSEDDPNRPIGRKRNSIINKVACGSFEAVVAYVCAYYGVGKNLVNQFALKPSQHYIDALGNIIKQKIALDERYHVDDAGWWLQRDIMAAFLIMHTLRSEEAQQKHEQFHEAGKIQAKGKNRAAMMDLFDLDAIKRDLPMLVAMNQLACDYILKYGSAHLRASFKLPKDKEARQKLQQGIRLPEHALRNMIVCELNMTNLKKPMFSGSVDLGYGYSRISTAFSYS